MIYYFDRQICKTLNEEVGAALEKIAEKHGLRFERKGGSYDEFSYKPSFRFTLSETRGGIPYEQEMFNQDCILYGLKPEHYGKHFKTPSGKVYKLTGLQPGRRKFPFVVETADGKEKLLSYEALDSIKATIA